MRPPYRAVAEVRAYTKNGHIEFVRCDISDLRLVFFHDPLQLLHACIAQLCLHAGLSKSLQTTTSNQARSCTVSSTTLAQLCLHTALQRMASRCGYIAFASAQQGTGRIRLLDILQQHLLMFDTHASVCTHKFQPKVLL